MTRRLIVTADDLGLSPEVNQGIFASHRQGIVTAASLLVNAPATAAAVEESRTCPQLEIGLHLGIVEGLALSEATSSLSDELRYFDGVCLHRDWRRFLGRYLAGRIDLGELRHELELQIRRFLTFFERIPFANATQHLHLLPGVRAVVLDLARQYRIGALRAPVIPRRRLWSRRGWAPLALDRLGRTLRRRAQAQAIHCTDFFLGFEASGDLSESGLRALLAELPEGSAELVTHPGLECGELRRLLRRSYGRFGWEAELRTLCAPGTREALTHYGVHLIRFADL